MREDQTAIVVTTYDPLASTRAEDVGSGFLDFGLIETNWESFANEVVRDLALATRQGWISTEIIISTTRIDSKGNIVTINEASLWYGAAQLLSAIRGYFAENPETSLGSVVLSVKDNTALETFLTKVVRENVGRITFH